MLYLSSYLLLLFLFCAATSLSSPARRSVADIKADVADISAKVTALDASITAFPASGGSLGAALLIHNSAAPLVASLQKGKADVDATGPLGDADGAAILSSVEAIEPTIQHALVGIVTKKPAFQALPIGGLPALILLDLRNLKAGTVAFSDALIASAPPTLVAEATALRDRVVTGFDAAIAAYS